MRVQFYSGAARSSAHLSFHQWSGALKCRCWRERSELLRRDRCSLKCRRRIHASPISSAASWSKAGVISGSRSLMPSGPVAIALLRRSVCFVPGLVWMHTIGEIRWLWKMQKRSIHPNHHYLYALMGVLFFVCCLHPVPRAMSEHFCRNNFLIGSLIDRPAVPRGDRRLSIALSSIWCNYFCHFSCKSLSDVWTHAIICIRDVHFKSFLWAVVSCPG